jgi:hypothetical protein
MRARGKAQRRAFVPLDHDRGTAVQADVLRPTLHVAGQAQIEHAIGVGLERERAALTGEAKVEPARPQADRVPLDGGTDAIRDLVVNPRRPGAESGGQVAPGRLRSSQWNAGKYGQDPDAAL